MFQNRHLEVLTLMSPRVFALCWALLLPAIAWSGWGTAAPGRGLALIAAGLVSWTLFEYVLHRFLFHWGLERTGVRWLIFLIHGNHHDNPGDPLRDMMPLSVSLPVAALVWGACVAAIGPAGTWLFLGWITGYVIYDAIHYACHQWPMRGRLSAALKRHHMRHHYVDDTSNYGISTMVWDRAFGTHIRARKR